MVGLSRVTFRSSACFRLFAGVFSGMKLVLIVGGLAAVALRADAQAKPTATREPVQVGVAFAFGSTDYTDAYVKGFTVYGDLAVARRISVEAEYHNLNIITPDDVGVSSALIGGRYAFSLEERATLYVKAMGGIGHFTYDSPNPNPHTDSYGIFGPGAGIEFRASHRINIRAIDLEYQFWPGYKPNGLSPWVASMGAAWTF